MIHVRRAGLSDGGSIAELCRQLGYPADERIVIERFPAIADDPGHAVFVAEDEGGRRRPGSCRSRVKRRERFHSPAIIEPEL